MKEDMKYEMSICEKLVNYNPKKRPSARDILKMEEYKAWKAEVVDDEDDD